MTSIERYRRLVVLTEGRLGVFSSKTAASLIRYRRNDVVAVLDSTAVGTSLEAVLGCGEEIPIVGSVGEAMHLGPDALVIGVAPAGGALPDAMRRHVVDALAQGLGIVSGLHELLASDPELAEVAERYGGRIHDLRDASHVRRIARGLARQARVKRVLTVGTDSSAGKMATALELRSAAVASGIDAAFVATGQTGIMIEGWGLAVDHVLSDFTAGAAELLIERVADRTLCIVEGQGSIAHPAYSGVMLSLLHGVCPDAMVMCHRPGRRLHNEWPDCPIAPIVRQIELYEAVLRPLWPGHVVAVSVNCAGLTDDDARREIDAVANETGLPATDPVRFGAGPILSAVRKSAGV